MTQIENTNEKSLLKTNVFLNGDSLKLLKQLPDNSIDYVITSPPYNYTCSFRVGRPKNGIQKRDKMYDSFNIKMSSEQYCQWTVSLFNELNRVLKKGGIILYNFSYNAKDPMLPETMLTSVHLNTSFTKIDTISWSKDKANPIASSNVLAQRTCEYVYVLMRKGERFFAQTNRKINSYGRKGQKNYKQQPNIISAPHGKKVRGLNNATFSVELIDQLLDAYVIDNATVLDPFMGVGTTAVSCLKAKRNIDFIGMELSEKQVDYSYKRVKEECGVDLLKNSISKEFNGTKQNNKRDNKRKEALNPPTVAQKRFYKRQSFNIKMASKIHKNKTLYSTKTWGEAISLAWKIDRKEVKLSERFDSSRYGHITNSAISKFTKQIDMISYNPDVHDLNMKKAEMVCLFEQINDKRTIWNKKLAIIRNHISNKDMFNAA